MENSLASLLVVPTGPLDINGSISTTLSEVKGEGHGRERPEQKELVNVSPWCSSWIPDPQNPWCSVSLRTKSNEGALVTCCRHPQTSSTWNVKGDTLSPLVSSVLCIRWTPNPWRGHWEPYQGPLNISSSETRSALSPLIICPPYLLPPSVPIRE